MTAGLRLVLGVIVVAMFVLMGARTRAQGTPITLSGLVFVDAAVAANPVVEVRVGDVVCSERGKPLPPPSGAPEDANRYLLTVLVARDRPGCPAVGAALAIFVNGRRAIQSPVLTAGAHNVDLFVGADLAVYSGVIDGGDPPAGSSITATVDGTRCGAAAITPRSQSGPAEYRFLIVPATCAGSGRVVTLDIAGSAVVGELRWASGLFAQPVTFRATRSPQPTLIVPPNTGSGGYLRRGRRSL